MKNLLQRKWDSIQFAKLEKNELDAPLKRYLLKHETHLMADSVYSNWLIAI